MFIRRYASGFGFEGGPFSFPIDLAIRSFSEIAFVHSPEEAVGFPDDVFVVWPGERTEMALEQFNNMITSSKDMERVREGGEYWADVFFATTNWFSVDDLMAMLEGINLPITMEDLVDNWEAVAEIFSRVRDQGSLLQWKPLQLSESQQLRMDKRNYALRFDFETGHQSLPLIQALNIPGYFGLPEIPFMEVAFVHSPEEAAGFPRDVFVAWPGSGTEEALESFINEVKTMRNTGQNLHGKQVSIPDELSLPTTVET